MFFSADSPFVAHSARLDPTLSLFLDGIRFSVEFIHLAYMRLAGTLDELTQKSPTGESRNFTEAEREAFTSRVISAFADAWQVVDSVNRFRNLLGRMPELNRRPAASP